MRTSVDVLRAGSALARRYMRIEAKEWRLRWGIGCSLRVCDEALAKAIEGREMAKRLKKLADEALRKEVGF